MCVCVCTCTQLEEVQQLYSSLDLMKGLLDSHEGVEGELLADGRGDGGKVLLSQGLKKASSTSQSDTQPLEGVLTAS